MGFPFSSAVVSTHAHATESEQRVLEALRALLPESAEVKQYQLKGHHGNPITGFEARICRRTPLRELWERMTAKLRAGCLEEVRSALPAMVDDSCRLYLRFDKQLAHRGELVLTDGGDAIHLKLRTAAFPAKREVAITLVDKLILEGRNDEEETQVHSV